MSRRRVRLRPWGEGRASVRRPRNQEPAMQSVNPCLVFKTGAEQAANFYVSVFPRSKLNHVVKTEADGPLPKGTVLHVSFELFGREYTAFDGGDGFTFSTGISLVATCETQAEIDDVWAKLSADGGKAGPCGWVTDKLGVSWQVVPKQL